MAPAALSACDSLREFEQGEVELARWQGSGDIAATAAANCYIVIPPDRERIAAGAWVPVLMLGRVPRIDWFSMAEGSLKIIKSSQCLV
jgi:hypothetical protein